MSVIRKRIRKETKELHFKPTLRSILTTTRSKLKKKQSKSNIMLGSIHFAKCSLKFIEILKISPKSD